MRRWFVALLAAGVLLPATASAETRIVTLGGSVTEIAYALGVGGQIVAVDTTSRHPAAVEGLPKVGYLRTLSAEGILSLRPDVVVGLDEAGPPQTLVQLRDSGATLKLVPEHYSTDGIIEKIHLVADLFGATERGKALASAVASDLAQVRSALSSVRQRPKVLFLLAASRGAPLAAGSETAAEAMIGLAGGENAVTGYKGYKPLSIEAAVAFAPDVIVMMQHSLEALGGPDVVLALPGVAATPAGKAKRLIAYDGLYLLGFGPRTAHAIRDLAQALHPGLNLLPLPTRAWAAP
jgi:iron complex transport system substrate-binding protein